MRGSHLGLGHNPAVVVVVADRLAQPRRSWHRFEATIVGPAVVPVVGAVVTAGSRLTMMMMGSARMSVEVRDG